MIFAASWIGLSATTIWIVEQLGFAMMPLCFQMSPGLTSGTTSGVPGSMRQALELSTTTAPFWAKSGEYCLEIDDPALKNAKSNFSTLSGVRPTMRHGLPLTWRTLPSDLGEA